MASKLELHRGDQFIIGFDHSGSMQTQDCPGNTRRFDYVLETLKAFVAEAAKWDPDGVSFYAFNNRLTEYQDVTSVDEINRTIGTLKPAGGTNTHLAITAAYKEHVKKASDQTLFLLFTDGEPSEPDEVKNAVVNITRSVKDEKEFRIAIITVGEQSPELKTWLTNLDDHLTEAKYDIIDVMRMEDVDFETAVANAIEG